MGSKPVPGGISAEGLNEMPWETMAGRSGLTHCRVQPPDAENRMSGGVGGSRCAITVTRPDHVGSEDIKTSKFDLNYKLVSLLHRSLPYLS